MFGIVTMGYKRASVIPEVKVDIHHAARPEDYGLLPGDAVPLEHRGSTPIAFQYTEEFTVDVLGMPPSAGTVSEAPDLWLLDARRCRRLGEVPGELPVDCTGAVAAVEIELPEGSYTPDLGVGDLIKGA